MPDFKPEVGFETEFNVRCEDRDFLHVWKVTKAIAETKTPTAGAMAVTRAIRSSRGNWPPQTTMKEARN